MFCISNIFSLISHFLDFLYQLNLCYLLLLRFFEFVFFIRFYFYESCTDRIKNIFYPSALKRRCQLKNASVAFSPLLRCAFLNFFLIIQITFITYNSYYYIISIRFYHLLIPIFLHLFETFFIRDIFPTPASPTRTTLITSASSLI